MHAFEPGCASGLLTYELAQRCDQVIATDAVVLARERVGSFLNVRVEQARIPDDLPTDTFDLVVISEMRYYCADLTLLARAVSTILTDEGVLVSCHWRHSAPDHPRTAEEVHAVLGHGRYRLLRHIEDDFLLGSGRGGDSPSWPRRASCSPPRSPTN